ncbi:MAG: sigma-70 family RNA polymerase sigma factor [Verrucomicrobiota bacterium]
MSEPSNSPPTEAFIRELTANQQAVRGFIHASLGGTAEADDVLQKTNLALWRKCSDWDPETSFLSWAIAVARFEILAFYRDSARDRLVFEPDVVEAMAATAELGAASAGDTNRSVALAECMRALKPEHQQLLDRRYAKGYSIQEIAEAKDRSADSVKSLLLRIRKSLRSCIENRIEKEALA